MSKKLKFAPRELFVQMLEYMAIPTFDVVIEYGQQGVVLVRRRIEPYKNVWALPGLRMLKGETIDETLQRIAEQELGLSIETTHKHILGQYVGMFQTEHDRQDISTGYLLHVSDDQGITINKEHFSSFRIVKTIPDNIGAMYKYYLSQYFKMKEST